MITLDKDWIAYCAGLYEGEGTVGSYVYQTNGTKYRMIKFGIAMSDLSPLQYFQDTFDVGQITGPYVRKASHKAVYSYSVHNFEHTQYIMAVLWPWLSRRRKEQYKVTVKKYFDFRGVR